MRATTLLAAALCALALALAGCGQGAETPAPAMPEPAASDKAPAAVTPALPVFEITARGLTFDAPATAEPGWTKVVLRNESPMVHFALLQRLPAGVGIAEHQAQVAPVFQRGMDLLNAGDTEAALQAFGELPEWFGDIVFIGGPGLVAAGRSAATTLLLEPGTYLVECYVKTGGRFHSYNPAEDAYGMVAQFEVTGTPTPATAPAPTWRVELSQAGGIRAEGSPRAGPQVIEVAFADQGPHENFVGHDLHVARLAPDADAALLSGWMDWRLAAGLQTPAPVEFIGGTNEMPAGSAAYLHVDLEPGRYALVSEVADPARKNMLLIFDVD